MGYSIEQIRAADEFSERVAQLENATAKLQALLRTADPIKARVFAVPRVTREEEEKTVSFIDPEPSEGAEAFRLGASALTDWYGVAGYSTKAVHRLPGALAYETDDAQSIMDAVSSCNGIKQAIKALLPRLGSRDDRFELIHRRHHMMILLQLTRQLTALACPPAIRSVTFTWGFKTEIYKLTLDEACEVLESMRKRPAPGGSLDGLTWGQRIDQELVNLRSLPATTELRHRRPLRIRPLVNVRYLLSEEEKQAREEAQARGEPINQPLKLYEGHTPLIILNPPHGMSIGALGSFSAEARSKRKPRKGLKTSVHPVTGIGSIYLVRPTPEEDEPDESLTVTV